MCGSDGVMVLECGVRAGLGIDIGVRGLDIGIGVICVWFRE